MLAGMCQHRPNRTQHMHTFWCEGKRQASGVRFSNSCTSCCCSLTLVSHVHWLPVRAITRHSHLVPCSPCNLYVEFQSSTSRRAEIYQLFLLRTVLSSANFSGNFTSDFHFYLDVGDGLRQSKWASLLPVPVRLAQGCASVYSMSGTFLSEQVGLLTAGAVTCKGAHCVLSSCVLARRV